MGPEDNRGARHRPQNEISPERGIKDLADAGERGPVQKKERVFRNGQEKAGCIANIASPIGVRRAEGLA